MVRALEQLLESVVGGILAQLNSLLPPLIVAVFLFVVFLAAAVAVRWVLTKAVKGARLDRFLKDVGVSSMLDDHGDVHTTPLVAGATFWLIVVAGALIGLSLFNTQLTTRMVESVVFLFPKLLTAGLILLTGIWLAQFLGRSILVWTHNEALPAPRRWAAVTKVLVLMVAVVASSEVLDFAPHVFFAAFVILASGLVLAASLAIGLGGRDAVRRFLDSRAAGKRAEEEEKSLWNHL
ncbi:MAG TPA: hypothetical protein PKJ41_04385 [Bryobacteraceae bacterium]|nr:hypothetical protein [Bryobacteraceae bacterium]HPT25982.1 hypothetical protein [Bryobacteraceae bacterium]